jgi:hypothetical protein
MGDTASGGRSIRFIVHLALGTITAGLGGAESEEDEPLVPKIDYYLDESDPDIVVLRRQDDGSFVAAFSARGATTEGILEAAKEDYLRLMEANADVLGLRGDGDRKRSA